MNAHTAAAALSLSTDDKTSTYVLCCMIIVWTDDARHLHLIVTGTRRSCMVSNLRTVIAGANSKPATSVSKPSGGTMKAPAAAQ